MLLKSTILFVNTLLPPPVVPPPSPWIGQSLQPIISNSSVEHVEFQGPDVLSGNRLKLGDVHCYVSGSPSTLPPWSSGFATIYDQFDAVYFPGNLLAFTIQEGSALSLDFWKTTTETTEVWTYVPTLTDFSRLQHIEKYNYKAFYN